MNSGEDWKKEVDIYNAQHQAKQQEKLANERKRQEEAREAARRVEYNQLLPKHKRTFKCHSKNEDGTNCDVVSSGPKGDWNYFDWYSPSVKLDRCNHCHKWTCFKHYHAGYCRKCHNYRMRTGKFPLTKQEQKVIVVKTLKIFIGVGIGSVTIFMLFIPSLRDIVTTIGAIIIVVILLTLISYAQ